MIDAILTFLHIDSPVMRKHAKQLVKFGMAGGTGTVVDLSTLTLFVEYFRIPTLFAGIFSSLLAVTIVFIVNKFFTFGNRERKFVRQIAKFALIYTAAFVMNVGMYSLLLQIGFHYLFAKILAIGVTALWNYYFSHTFIFKK